MKKALTIFLAAGMACAAYGAWITISNLEINASTSDYSTNAGAATDLTARAAASVAGTQQVARIAVIEANTNTWNAAGTNDRAYLATVYYPTSNPSGYITAAGLVTTNDARYLAALTNGGSGSLTLTGGNAITNNGSMAGLTGMTLSQLPAAVLTNNQTGVTLSGALTATSGNCLTNNGSGNLTITGSPAATLGAATATSLSVNGVSITANGAVGTIITNKASPTFTMLTVTGGTSQTMWLYGNVNNYWEANIMNVNTGSSASADWIATAANGSSTNHYIDMGINNQNGATFPFTNANWAYLYTSDDPLFIWSGATNGATTAVYLGAGNTTNATVAISSNNVVVSSNMTVSGNSTLSGTLSVGGTVSPWLHNITNEYVVPFYAFGAAVTTLIARINEAQTLTQIVARADIGACTVTVYTASDPLSAWSGWTSNTTITVSTTPTTNNCSISIAAGSGIAYCPSSGYSAVTNGVFIPRTVTK